MIYFSIVRFSVTSEALSDPTESLSMGFIRHLEKFCLFGVIG